LKDEAQNWELKADQLGAGYDSVFVSVMPKGSTPSNGETLNQTHQTSIQTQPAFDESSITSPHATTPSHHNHDNKTIH
jgi:hypothetical protein